ncbi:MAG: U32 family peptidase [Candidatus Fimenecus sp.]
MKTKPEVLAPCGSFDALTAALRTGADAVYFGAGDFNARKNADNFGGEQLSAAAKECRLHGVKFHVTLNTLVGDGELENFTQTVKRTCQVAADALILQDLGALRLVRALCPDMELHASTQMSVGTKAGLQLLKELGFSRAVLPRELAKSEIADLAADKPLDLEVFVHGAQCMCVSGQCLLSATFGSRSGNRGLCAQPCRLAFSAVGGTGHDLSLKDLSLIEHLQELSALGIVSLKIEGRMKRPEYVAAAVTACKEALDGAYSASRRQDLEALFSRSGFTDGYFRNQRGREMFGIRQKENVTAATDALLKAYAKRYEKEPALYGVDFHFFAAPGKTPTLTAVCNGIEVCETGAMPCETAQRVPLTAEKATAQLQKCGGTVFFAKSIACEIAENTSVPLSELNRMRRAVLSTLTEQLQSAHPKEIKPYNFTKVPHIAKVPQTWVRVRAAAQIPKNSQFDRLFLPLGTENAVLEQYGAGVYLPRGLFGTEDEILRNLQHSAARYVLCDTLDAVAIARKTDKEIIGGPFLNLFNTLALEEAAAIGVSAAVVSHELTVSQISALGGALPRGACVYGRTPLMLTRNCPVKNGKSCKECNRQSVLCDRKGISFPVRCENGFAELFNSRPTYMADRLSELQNIDFYFFDFTIEERQECEQVLHAYKQGAKPMGEYTRGFFYRGVE